MFFDNFFNKVRKNFVKSFSPLVFFEDSFIGKSYDFYFNSIKSEFLDSVNSEELVFRKFNDVCLNYDKLFYEDLDYRNVIFDISARNFGRENSKTCSFNLDSDSVYEVLDGEGFFLIEDLEKNVTNIIKVKSGNYVVVPAKSYFVIINSSIENNLCVFGLFSKNCDFMENVLVRENGANLFFTNSGFVKNLNISGNYILNNFEGDFIQELDFNKEKGLYRESLDNSERFNFLR